MTPLMPVFTYSVESEVPDQTASMSCRHTSVLDLRWTGVGVHLRQLQLGLGTDSLGETGVADHVAKRLSVGHSSQILDPRIVAGRAG